MRKFKKKVKELVEQYGSYPDLVESVLGKHFSQEIESGAPTSPKKVKNKKEERSVQD